MPRLTFERRKTKPLFIAGVCLLLGIVSYLFWGLPDSAAGTVRLLASYGQLSPLHLGDRITIISPHLDDETIGLGGFIAQARQQGVMVNVVFMTNGDDNPLGADLEFKTGYPTPAQLIQSGEDRQQEAISALQKLGVERGSIYFLGLPDRGLKDMLQSRYASSPYRSPGTLQSSSPYLTSYILQLPYTGNATRQALTKAINQTKPTLIFTTLPDDYHTDHAATAQFVQQVLPNVTTHPDLYYFLIHYPRYPQPRGVNSNLPLLPPKSLQNRDWKIIFLHASDVDRQKQATNEYKSQLRIPLLGRLMESFIRSNEIVLPGR